MDTKLKPCPFCGSTNLHIPDYTGLHTQEWWCLSLQCNDCGIRGPRTVLKLYKANGQLYAYGSRRPKSPQLARRWNATIDRAIQTSIDLWNKRS